MKLWKRTVALMLITFLCSLIPVGVLSLYVTGKRNLNNAAETYGRQLTNGKNLLEQFWDSSKYEQMSETGKKSYLEFQFLRCCGEEMILINSESKEAVVNRTNYNIVSIDNLDLSDKTDPYEYKIQKLNHKYLFLQQGLLTNPEGYEILSVRDVTSMFTELRQTAVWFLGIYLAVFCIAGLFIYLMMRRTVQQMERLQEVAGKQEMLMGALAHEMKTPLTSIIGYSDTLRHVKLNDEQKDRSLEHISREGKRLEKLSGKMLQMLGLHQNDSIKMELHTIGELLEHVVQLEAEPAAQRQIQLQTEYEDFFLKMDDELMESLLVNLIDNAFRATEAGGHITISFTRYPSIDAQTVEMTITKVQLGYMRVRKGSSSTEGSLIPVWDFYGTWNSQEPGYADGSNEMVIDSVTMDRIGVPLLTIDARDGSVVQRVQNGPSSGTFPGGVGECE